MSEIAYEARLVRDKIDYNTKKWVESGNMLADITVKEVIEELTELSEYADQVIEQAKQRGKIEARGYHDGVNAGHWVIDGNTHPVTAKRLLVGLENGDPEVLDSLPEPQLGGEHADDPTWADVLNDEGIIDDPQDMPDDGHQELYVAYCGAFQRGVQDSVTRDARNLL